MPDCDIVVIGGGIAGLVCSAFLAREGRDVTLLEQNHQVGGNMSGFRRRGYYFDGGDQSFESLGIVFPILDALGVYSAQDWVKVRYRMVSDDFDFFIDSVDGVREALQGAFPEEPGLSPLFREISEVSAFLDAVGDAHRLPVINEFSLPRLLSMAPWLPRLFKWTRFRYRQKVCSFIENPALRHWLTEVGYYRMPYLFFAGFWHIWAQDYWYPVGGMQALLDKIAAKILVAGGSIRTKTLVTSVRPLRDGSAEIKTADGGTLSAGRVVYAGDYRRFYEEILPQESVGVLRRRKIVKAKLTEAILTVFLGLDLPPDELNARLAAEHVFYFPNYEAIFPDEGSPRDIHSRMWVALNSFGNPLGTTAPPGHTTMTLQTYSSAGWQDYWHNGGYGVPRSPDYEPFKNVVGRELVKTAEKVMPDLGDRISYYEVGTPLSLERYTRNSEGSTGGWCYQDTVSPLFRRRSLNMIRTPFKNVYTAGHYSVWPGGVISAALSGRLVANIVAGRRPLAPLSVATTDKPGGVS